ncbi:hypothetical protein [Sphingomonas humi]|uniref:Uncharacterized protein n=1 Tax=Sphingomonas humi TaxID=335630 RepID=A0ABP7SCW3_9SPHN
MSLGPATRLAALHSESAKDAISLRLPPAEIGEREHPQAIIENAIDALIEQIEAALSSGQEEVLLSLDVAEFIAIALKSRIRPAGRPRLSRHQKALRAAAISYARKVKAYLVKTGVAPGEAELEAASAAAGFGGEHGDPASASTILKLMKNRGKKLT